MIADINDFHEQYPGYAEENPFCGFGHLLRGHVSYFVHYINHPEMHRMFLMMFFDKIQNETMGDMITNDNGRITFPFLEYLDDN